MGPIARDGVLHHLISKHEHCWCAGSSEVKLCSSPVSSGSIVPDFVVSSISDPVGKRAV